MTTRILLAAAALLACATALSGSASASAPKPFLYWASYDAGNIGRANLGGSGANASFVTGGSKPCSNIAVTRMYVYWTNYGGNTIGRAKLDGTGVDQNFISAPGGPCGITAYAGHLYWAGYNTDEIGRASLDGSGVNGSFVPSAGDQPCGIGSGSGYVYWEDYTGGVVGRVKPNGTGANASFIKNAGKGCYGVAADAHHLYWVAWSADENFSHIARANLDGSNPNLDFIEANSEASAVAVSTSYIYWSTSSGGTIGRAALNGTGVDDNFITDAENFGLGVSAPDTKTTLHASGTGSRVTYTATVAPLPDGGKVTFTANGHPIHGCGAKAVSFVTGKAKCAVNYKAKGTWSIQANYSGDASFVGSSSSTLKETVK